MADFRFHRQQRLLNAGQFQRVFNHTDFKASTRDLLILGAANDLDHSRIGFIIAKKNVRTAVQRNRIKRAIREYFRLHSNELPPSDLVIIARKGLGDRSGAEIKTTFSTLWHKLVRHAKAASRPRQ